MPPPPPPPPWPSEQEKEEPEASRSGSPWRSDHVRGRTLERTNHTTHYHRPSPGSRGSSVCSVRSMMNVCLERAHQDRLQSGSRDRSPPPSPFQAYSPFYDEYARDASVSARSRDVSSFESHRGRTEEIHNSMLRSRELCTCDYCWDDCHLMDDVEICGYCSLEFPRIVNAQMHPEHLAYFHYYGESLRAKRSFWMDHFRLCLKEHPSSSEYSSSSGDEQSPEPEQPVMAVDQYGRSASSTPVFAVPSSLKTPMSRSRFTQSHSRVPVEDLIFRDTSQAGYMPASRESDVAKGEISRKANPAHKRTMSSSLMAPTALDASQNGSIVVDQYVRMSKPAASAKRRLEVNGSEARVDCTSKKAKCIGSNPRGSDSQTGMMQSVTHKESAQSLRLDRQARSTNPPSPLFTCQTCKRAFARRGSLLNHQRSHTGEKPFLCRIPRCGKRFAQQSDKTRHEQAQHSEKTFVCGGTNAAGPSWGCGKAFRRKDGLLEHHQKTVKGRQCVARRDRIFMSESLDDGRSSTNG